MAASPWDLLPVCKTRHGLPEAAGAITWSQTLLVMGSHGLELPQLQLVGAEHSPSTAQEGWLLPAGCHPLPRAPGSSTRGSLSPCGSTGQEGLGDRTEKGL